MTLRPATWSTSSSSEPSLHLPPLPARHNRMAISNLLQPTPYITNIQYPSSQRRERATQPQDYRNPPQQSESYPAVYTASRSSLKAGEQKRHMGKRDLDDRSSDGSIPSPSPSHSSLSPVIEKPYYHSQSHRRVDSNSFYRSDPRPSTATSSAMDSPTARFAQMLSPDNMAGKKPEVKNQTVSRSATIYNRSHGRRHGGAGRPFGMLKQGRHFCTYVQHQTNESCISWQDGYGTWYDLARHADAEHGPEEVALIDQGLLTFEHAQWIKSEEQRVAIKRTMGSMVCQDCGTVFASNRLDSIERHVRKGACERAQEKQREKSDNYSATIHKKKGGKTAAKHTRR